MRFDDLLAQSGGFDAIARDLGISEADARAGAAALLPALLGGFDRRAPAAGPAGLGDLLDQLGGGSLLDQVLAPQPTPAQPGNEVLGQIFGSKDVSRTVAQHAAGRSGLSPQLLKKMLPLLAMLVTGYLSRRARAGGTGAAVPGGGGLGDLLGSILGGTSARSGGGAFGGLGAMLDADGNGNPLDDILRQAGRAPR